MTATFGIDGGEYRLRPEQIHAFAEDGYLVLERFLSEEELRPLEVVYERFKSGVVGGMGRDLCDMSGPYSRPFDEYNMVNCVLPRVYDLSLVGNLYELRAASVARQLIGADATLDYDQHLSKKPRREAAVFAWHQDLGYWPTGTPDTKTTTCSLALDDADVENGCLHVVPGSHRESTLRPHVPILRSEVGDREETHALSVELRSSDTLVPLPVRRGDITVHNERIIHGSAGNPSDRWRRTYIVAHRSRATVEYERSIGFTHSHNDRVQWRTHLEALESP